jgi:glycosyltransferase involved in cell wall biosynthesis
MTTADARIRVLQVIGALDFGGAENVVAALATHVDRSRFDVKIACTRGLGRLVDGLRRDGIDVVLAAPPHRRYRHFTPVWLQRVISRFRPHVIHTHTLTALAIAGPLGYLRLMPPWVHTFHYGKYPYPNPGDMRTERIFSKAVTQLVAVADPQRQAIVEHHGIAPSRIITILNGVPANPFVDTPGARERKRAELGFRPEDAVIGTVAVLSEQKGITYLLQAARQVIARWPAAKFLVVGGGPLESSLKQEAAALGLEAVVTFAGWRQDVPEILPALDVWVMSSLWEAMPLALLEAMAARRPMVVTDVGDNAAFVDRGACAMVVPPRDASGLASAILALISDSEQATHLSNRAFARYVSNFGVKTMADSYETLYSKLSPSRAE